MAFTIDFGNEEFVPFEGGGSDLVPVEGAFELECEGIKEGKAESSGNQKLVFTFRTVDEKFGGYRVIKHIPVTGKRKDGKDNVQGLKEALFSMYSGVTGDEDQAKAKVNALLGKKMESDQLAAAITHKRYYGEISARQYENDKGQLVWTSELSSLISKQKYEDRKSFRKAIPAAAQAQIGAGASASGGGSASASSGSAADVLGTAPASNGAAAAAQPSQKQVADALGIL
jgi:hypothetical protein